MHEPSTVTVPRWVLMLFTVLQPVIATAIIGGVTLLWGLNQQVVILNVKMETALKTDGKLEAIGERITLTNERVSRLEGQADGK